MAARDPKLYFYDTIADRFDELVNAYDLRRRLEIVFDELLGPGDLTGRTVLDVCCGSGWFSREAARRGAARASPRSTSRCGCCTKRGGKSSGQ